VRILGIDLAWGQGRPGVPPNETGVVAVELDGRVVDAGWTRGVEATAAWMGRWAGPGAIAMVDAPLVVTNATGMRECEKEIGRRYGRWKVSANASNLGLPGVLAGVALVARTVGDGWAVADGRGGPPRGGRSLYECFPYLALVGAPALGYDRERPIYKRRPRHLEPAAFRAVRARNADEIVHRVAALDDPPIDLRAHPATAALLDEPTPLDDRGAKHREDLLDAVLCAWTGLLWWHHGLARCQVLGGDETPPATVVAPCRPEQRRPPSAGTEGPGTPGTDRGGGHPL
jgi:predicted RNase H-like nuclease